MAAKAIGSEVKAYEKVMAYIKNSIINHELKIGSKLPPERDIAEELQVSRNSVREGIHMMKIMGFISSQQGAGNYISCDFEKNMTESLSMMFMLHELDYDQISHLRYALESEAFSLAVDNVTEEEINDFKTYIANLDENRSEEENVIWDKKIHYGIVKASRNVMIEDIYSALSEVIDTFAADMRLEVLKGPNRDRLQMAHKEIVSCLVDKDRLGGLRAIKNHFDYVEQALGDETEFGR